MRIDNNSLGLTQAISRTQADQSSNKTGAGAPQRGADQIQISDMATLLSANQSKVDKLQLAVRSGTYNVSPEQIASSIINDALLY